MANNIDQIKDPPNSFLSSIKYLGPGVILSAAIVGSGELIATTALGAKAGFALLWVILLGCIIKVGIQIEYGRHAICSGESTFTTWSKTKGFRLANLHWTVYVALVYIIMNIFGQGGILGAAVQVIEYAFPNIGKPIAISLLAIAIALLVFHGKYGPLEFISIALNVFFVIAIFVCVFNIQKTPYAFSFSDFASGFSPNLPKEYIALAISAFGITGVAAGEIFIYASWCIEKGYAAWTGPKEDSEEWANRAQGWIRVMKMDAFVSMLIYTVSTVGFYILGATILHAQDKLEDGNQLIFQLSGMFTETLGPKTMALFMICAFCVLFSTVFSNNASNSRLWSDFFVLFKIIDPNDPKKYKRSISIMAWILPILWAILFLFFQRPLLLITIMGIANSIFLLIVAYQALVYRYQYCDSKLKPSIQSDLYLWAGFLTIVFLGCLAIYKTLT